MERIETKGKDEFVIGLDYEVEEKSKEENENKPGLKTKKKADKKMGRKLAKAVNVILFHEGAMEKIFTDEPSEYMWIYHFGNGDEDDQKGIKEYFNQKFGDCKVYMFPGISYGFLHFKDKETAWKVIESNESFEVIEDPHKQEVKNLSSSNTNNDLSSGTSTSTNKTNAKYEKPSGKIKHSGHEIKFKTGERTVFVFYSKITLEEVQQNKNTTGTFPVASYSINIPGIYIIDSFLSEEEEKKLIEDIDFQQWNKLTNRRVQHYGYEFIYGANNVNKNNKIGELPSFCQGTLNKLEENLKRFHLNEDAYNKNKVKDYILQESSSLTQPSFYETFGNFDQLTINDYAPGEGIPPHVDSHSPFEDVFCSLSLGSGSVMTFTSPDPEEPQKHVYLKPRSVVFFAGDARYIWQHSISLRKLDRVEDDIIFRKRRISLTFRKVRTGDCSCPYKEFCDSQNGKSKTQINSSTPLPLEDSGIKIDSTITTNGNPTDIEKKHVYDVYEKIAPHFSHTRYKPWPKVAEYMNSLPKCSFNADVGCGNGKYLNVNDNIFSFGTDRSFNLISICKEKSKNNQLFVADSLRLPIRSETFDSVISIAVVHHFSTVELRLKAISELIRILRIKGTMLIYVWAMEQEEKKFTQQDNFVPWHLQETYENQNQLSTLGPQIVKEEKKNATVYHRYYHVFVKGELEDLLQKIENISVLESYYDHANWCCIVRKEW